MRLRFVLAFIASLTLVLPLMGYCTIPGAFGSTCTLDAMYNRISTPQGIQDVLGNVIVSIANPKDIGQLAALGGATIVVIGIMALSGFSATYIVPALILYAILSSLVMPTALFTDPGLHVVFRTALVLIYNGAMLILVIGFIRGSEI